MSWCARMYLYTKEKSFPIFFPNPQTVCMKKANQTSTRFNRIMIYDLFYYNLRQMILKSCKIQKKTSEIMILLSLFSIIANSLDYIPYASKNSGIFNLFRISLGFCRKMVTSIIFVVHDDERVYHHHFTQLHLKRFQNFFQKVL